MMKFTLSLMGSSVERVGFSHKGGRCIQSTLSLHLGKQDTFMIFLQYCSLEGKRKMELFIYPKLQVAHAINDAEGFTSSNTTVN